MQEKGWFLSLQGTPNTLRSQLIVSRHGGTSAADFPLSANFLEYPRHLQRDLCVLVQIILRQTQNLILQTPGRLEVAAPILVKDPRVHELREPDEVALFQLLASGPVAVDRGFVADFPVVDIGVRHAHDRVQHVPLADSEGGNVDEPVPESRQARAPVVAFVFR